MPETKLTRDTFDRLHAELEDLRTRGRIDIARAIESARALGDLSENGDYHAAKDSQGKMEARIRQLEAMLDGAVVIDADAVGTADEVIPGLVVSLRYAGDDDVERFLIGSIEERREGVAVVSPASPLGQALIGRKKGDVVTYEAPSGHLEVEVVEVGSEPARISLDVIDDAGRAPLASRGWIGDGLTGAVTGPDGTVDWLATAGLERPADFYALIDPLGGAIRVGPAGTRRSRPGRSESDGAAGVGGVQSGAGYRAGTMVSELELPGPTGRVRITDLFPWPGPNERPSGRLVRLVTALAGPLDVEVEVRPGRSLAPARKVSTFADGLAWDGLVVRTGFPLHAATDRGDGPTWRGVRRLAPGEGFVITVDRLDDEHHVPLSLDSAAAVVASTEAAWRSWVAPLQAEGPYRDAVERAALTLRSLSGGGAPLAAATTSLPRRGGSERTEDERFVRWRDAATAAGTLARVGLPEDAEAAEAWLRRAVDDTELPWPQASTAAGEPVPEEEEQVALAGWRHSQPVRFGFPERRLDLDVYGDVVGAISASTSGENSGPDADPWAARARPGPLSAATAALAEAADWVAEHWRQPDHGVWSLGAAPHLLVGSHVQAWYALDRLARLTRAANPLDLAAIPWQQAAREIVAWLETDALAADGGLRLAPSPQDYADAALLRVAWRSPWPPDHAIVVRTVNRTLERLSSGPWVMRHSPEIDDGRAGPDHPDLLASLWAVRALAALGRWEEAHDRMERICALPGPAGIFTTAVDPLAGELLGNLPAAGVHLAVIDAAVALERGPR